MSKAERVSAAQELAIVRLVNECRELGDDAAAWQDRLVDGLRGLTAGIIAAVGPTPPLRVTITQGAAAYWVKQHAGGGWPSAAVKARWEAWAANPEAVRHHPGVAGFWARPEPTLTLVRQEIVADHVWERSPFVNDALRPDGMDEGLIGRADVPVIGGGYCYTVIRAKGERPFGRRDGAVAAALFRAIGPHLGRSLLLTTQPNRHGLSPRLREVLDCLLDGDSEKEAALRLGLQRTTIHDHVKRLYKHFGVSSRAELLAYFLRRYRGANGAGR